MNKISEEEQRIIDRDVEEMVALASAPILPKMEKIKPQQEVVSKPINVSYKFNEEQYVKELVYHIKDTYGSHYSGKYQATDMIIDSGHGTGFCVGSIMKYAKRYGKKEGYNRKDILKILHYGLILLYVHDQENNDA